MRSSTQAKKDLAAGEGRPKRVEEVEREETAARCRELEELNASLSQDVEKRSPNIKPPFKCSLGRAPLSRGSTTRSPGNPHPVESSGDLDNSVRMQRDLAVRQRTFDRSKQRSSRAV